MLCVEASIEKIHHREKYQLVDTIPSTYRIISLLTATHANGNINMENRCNNAGVRLKWKNKLGVTFMPRNAIIPSLSVIQVDKLDANRSRVYAHEGLMEPCLSSGYTICQLCT